MSHERTRIGTPIRNISYGPVGAGASGLRPAAPHAGFCPVCHRPPRRRTYSGPNRGRLGLYHIRSQRSVQTRLPLECRAWLPHILASELPGHGSPPNWTAEEVGEADTVPARKSADYRSSQEGICPRTRRVAASIYLRGDSRPDGEYGHSRGRSDPSDDWRRQARFTSFQT